MRGEGRQEIRCAIYTRQSVAGGRGDDFNSCQAQREACEAFVLSMRRERWRLISEDFDDIGYSGKDFDRPGFQKLAAWIADGKVDQIVVQRFDRLTRRLTDWAKLSEFLQEFSVTLSVVDGGVEAMGGAFTEFVTNILATFGQFERDLIQDRMREARQYRALKGMRFAGKTPVGYRSNPMDGQLVIDEAEAGPVRRFFEMAADGKSASDIARIINEEGHRSKKHGKEGGKLWTGRTVLQVIRNPVYLGQRYFDGQWITGVHEPLVTKTLADEVTRRIAERRSRKPGRRNTLKNDPFVLRGILRCGKCDRPMTTSSSRVQSKSDDAERVYRYYRCRGNADGPPCKPAVQVAAQIVESEVERLLANPWKIVPAPLKVKKLLSSFADRWERLSNIKKSILVRELVWTATWEPEQRKMHIMVDQINLKRISKDERGE